MATKKKKKKRRLPPIVTAETLRKLGACADAVARYRENFPHGLFLDKFGISAAIFRGFHPSWLLGKLCPANNAAWVTQAEMEFLRARYKFAEKVARILAPALRRKKL